MIPTIETNIKHCTNDAEVKSILNGYCAVNLLDVWLGNRGNINDHVHSLL